MGLLSWFACGAPKQRRPRRRGRRTRASKRGRATGLTIRTSAGPPAPSEDFFFDALDDHPGSARSSHSVAGSDDVFHDAISPASSMMNGSTHAFSGSSDSEGHSSEDDEAYGDDGMLNRFSAWWSRREHSPERPPSSARRSSVDGLGSGRLSASPPPGSAVLEPDLPPMTGCISIFSAAQVALAQRRFLRVGKPKAGSSFRRHLPSDDAAQSPLCWQPTDAHTFQVRAHDYMKSKLKEGSGPAFYHLVGVDMFSFDFKLYHIAQHVELPPAPVLGPTAAALPPDQRLPPLLIVNLQLPTYAPSIFGVNDGEGHSLVYYFALPEGWEPSQVENQAALGLLQRFVHNGREADGQPTRDRLKVIPRIVNPDEFVEKGPLSSGEARLLRNYNGKPLLTRPQQRFFTGGSYLEVDLDIHNWAYIARRALSTYLTRLAPVIFDNAFVLQGNRPEELPEVVFAASRVHRVDFTKSRPFPAQSLQDLGHGLQPDGEAPPL